ncbi:hypothetical protein CapIbe_011419 [Capra ibex]
MAYSTGLHLRFLDQQYQRHLESIKVPKATWCRADPGASHSQLAGLLTGGPHAPESSSMITGCRDITLADTLRGMKQKREQMTHCEKGFARESPCRRQQREASRVPHLLISAFTKSQLSSYYVPERSKELGCNRTWNRVCSLPSGILCSSKQNRGQPGGEVNYMMTSL